MEARFKLSEKNLFTVSNAKIHQLPVLPEEFVLSIRKSENEIQLFHLQTSKFLHSILFKEIRAISRDSNNNNVIRLHTRAGTLQFGSNQANHIYTRLMDALDACDAPNKRQRVQAKEDELNIIITELKNNSELQQEKNAQLERDKSESLDSLARERDLMRRAQEDNADADQKSSREITCSQQYNTKILEETCTMLREVKNELKNKALSEKEALNKEIASLRSDLQNVRDDRDRQLLQVSALTEEVEKYKDSAGGKYCAQLDTFQISEFSAMESRREFDDLQNRLADANLKIVEAEKLRKKLHNTILELKGNIRVFCRVRPLLEHEATSDSNIISFPTSMERKGRGIDLCQNGENHSFTYDRVFMPEASQDVVFEEISQLVQSALDGYKVCIFAYGQTGSGKTYTMMGRRGIKDHEGLIPRSMEQVFETRQNLQSQGWKYEMQVSVLEIYNEIIRDLLAPNRSGFDESNNARKQYAIKHDANGNISVSDLTIVDVQSSGEVFTLLETAAKRRSVAKTQMNEESSRSHLVCTLRIGGVHKGTERVQGLLNLIDLAGSERQSKSGSDRQEETKSINKSLLSIGNVIRALAIKNEFIPYRDSKITHLLKPCLGGGSKTLMFVHVSPDPSSMTESLSSLRFAAIVNDCEIGNKLNQIKDGR